MAEVQSLENKRLEVAKELLHTEQTYLEKLTFLRMVTGFSSFVIITVVILL